MTWRYITTLDDPPPGFVHVEAISRLDIRRGVFAVLVTELESFRADFGTLFDSVSGLVITLDDFFAIEQLGPQLWHVRVPLQQRDRLQDVTRQHLELVATIKEKNTSNKRLARRLDRTEDDLKRLLEYTRLTLDRTKTDYEERAKWSIAALSALVRFAASEELEGAPITAYPDLFVDLLEGEPFLYTSAAIEGKAEPPVQSTNGMTTQTEAGKRIWSDGPKLFVPLQLPQGPRTLVITDMTPLKSFGEEELSFFRMFSAYVATSFKRKGLALELEASELRLRRANAELREQMAEREKAQRERDALQEEFMESARMAGMAEMATNVVHNIGNVLNSVNVSAELAAQHVRRSRLDRVEMVATLLQEQEDLVTFFAEDGRGRHLPAFLHQLAATLEGEQKAVLAALQDLRKDVEHIRNVIQWQQTAVHGVEETIHPHALADDAIRIVRPGFDRRDIVLELSTEEELPPLRVDKHKVAQILVNLLKNAMQAVEAARRNNGGRVSLSISQCFGRDFLTMSVKDNGVGIPDSDMQKVFSHGFTTKKNGHGFGLHSCKEAAKQLGGSLSAESPGKGHGATFMLTLPITQSAGYQRTSETTQD